MLVAKFSITYAPSVTPGDPRFPAEVLTDHDCESDGEWYVFSHTIGGAPDSVRIFKCAVRSVERIQD